MKRITTFALITAAVAALDTTAAFADDQQLQNRLALQRAQKEREQRATIAVYAGRHGVAQRHTKAPKRAETRFELRTNAHGQQFGVWVPVK